MNAARLVATPETCFWGFFDKGLAPVMTLESGDIVHVETLTHQAGDAPDLLMDEGIRGIYERITPNQRGPGVHLMTGPIYVEGAAVGDTLEVRILSMHPRLPFGTNIAAHWGCLYQEFRKERITIYRIEEENGVARAECAFDFSARQLYDRPGTLSPVGKRDSALADVVVPLRPHLGVAGVAPRKEGRINSVPPGEFGGNVDNWRFGPGTAMYYPVFNEGALFFAGDPHMAEGDGEISGTAIECSANVTLQLTVRKDFPLTYPMLQTDSHWYSHGFDEDLDEAQRQAALQMLTFLCNQKGLSRDDAYSLMSVAADFGVTQVVDRRKGVHAGIAKNLFSARRG